MRVMRTQGRIILLFRNKPTSRLTGGNVEEDVKLVKVIGGIRLTNKEETLLGKS